ncbi:unnamed protein product [Calypogeia fissa]
MGRSPYLQHWHKMPTLTASDVTPSALGDTLLPRSDSPHEVHSESAPLRNTYLSRGRHIGAKKKNSGSMKSVPEADMKTAEATDLAPPEKKSSEPNRLYLRRWSLFRQTIADDDRAWVAVRPVRTDDSVISSCCIAHLYVHVHQLCCYNRLLPESDDYWVEPTHLGGHRGLSVSEINLTGLDGRGSFRSHGLTNCIHHGDELGHTLGKQHERLWRRTFLTRLQPVLDSIQFQAGSRKPESL